MLNSKLLEVNVNDTGAYINNGSPLYIGTLETQILGFNSVNLLSFNLHFIICIKLKKNKTCFFFIFFKDNAYLI